MKTTDLIGREYEAGQIERALHSNESELIILYGRRRVGKTFLVNSFFQNRFAFKHTGIYDKPASVQLERFAVSLEEYGGLPGDPPENWFKAFDLLKHYLKGMTTSEKKVVFIDEMPWLDSPGSDFVAALENFWNGWASAEGDIVLIACGSATSWITDKLLGDKGGLFNRSASRIYLHPFNLRETEAYLSSRGFQWSRYDIAECYMIMGGIPFYLKQLLPEFSLTQNIDHLFFKDKGPLWDEFGHLYKTLFKSADSHIQVVETLAKKKMGMTRIEIANEGKLPDNGKLSAILKNLEGSGFIRTCQFFGNKKKDIIYQLCDYYSLFYLTYIRDNYGKDPHFWTHYLDNPSRRAWSGFAFEQLCGGHLPQIRQKLGISGILSETSSWFSKGKDGRRGAQIDLLIDRRDHIINICEMKYSLSEYSIDKDYEEALRRKMEVFREESKTRKSLVLTFITTFGVKPNMYSNRVQSQVQLDDLFAEAQ